MERLRWTPRWRAAAVAAASVGVGAIAGLVALGLVPPTRGDVGPGSVTVRSTWHVGGGTELLVPPLGSLAASTHSAPLRVEATVDRVDLLELESVVEAPDPTEELYAAASDDLSALVRRFALRSLAGAVIAGMLAGALFFRHRIRHVIVGGVAAGGTVALLLTFTWWGYDERAFDEPNYRGVLAHAPSVMEAAQRHVRGFEDVRARIDVLAAQISDLYAVSSLPRRSPDDAATVLLHVSDIHLNPLGLEITRELAESFEVDAVLDTGDLTSFGHPVESRVVQGIAAVGARYLFVPGNHDSEENRRAVDDIPNVRLLDGRPYEIGGITILGVADPTFTATNEIDSDEAADIRQSDSTRVASLVRRHRPDLLAVHDIRLGERSDGYVPVIVSGHLHERRTRSLPGGSLWLSVGSTGATGLGTFTVSGGEPYEAQVLRFDGPCLTAVDYVSLEGVDGSFELQRRTFDMVPTAAGRCRPATTSTTTTTEAPTTEAPTAEPTPAD